MRAPTGIALIFGLCLLAGPASAGPERIIRIDVPSHDAVYSLARRADLAVIDARDGFITAYADDARIALVRSLGYKVTVLVEDYQAQAALDLIDYHTFTQVCSTLHALALAYPGIARLETLGLSYGSRPIPAMKVTLDPATAHTRPRIRLVGAHHGNEKISTEITLAFLKYLLESYPGNQQLKGLVDNRETWFVPVVNPDGHVSNSRGNGSGRDLNRDYGYEWENYSEPFSQPETRALRLQAENHMPSLEFGYHSTASYVNYAWDNHPADPPDSGLFIALSQRYADSTYGSSLTRLVAINGYDWYEVHGSCQDYTFGVYGAPAWTIETQLPSTRVRIDSVCLANRRALLDFVTMAGWGVSGLVCDSLTRSPLFARIEFTAPVRWPCYTDLAKGDFHKMLASGSYTVRIRANGYLARDFNVVVPDTGAAFIDCALLPAATDSLCYAQKTVALRRVDDNHVYSDWVWAAFGPPDGSYYTLGSGTSSVVFDLDPAMPAVNHPGNDITVHAQNGYSAYAGNNWQGPWTLLGTASGTASFDLGAVGLDSARYVRLQNSSSGRIDAIAYSGRALTVVEQPALVPAPPAIAVRPNPARGSVRVLLPASATTRTLAVCDAAGRRVRVLAFTSGPALSVPLAGLAPGVYLFRAQSGADAASARLVVSR